MYTYREKKISNDDNDQKNIEKEKDRKQKNKIETLLEIRVANQFGPSSS